MSPRALLTLASLLVAVALERLAHYGATGLIRVELHQAGIAPDEIAVILTGL